jgi:hypothetical protein
VANIPAMAVKSTLKWKRSLPPAKMRHKFDDL